MTRTNTVMLSILVALAAATTILPSVYAQTSSPPISGASPSQQATENACPPGTTSFSQGECTVTTTTANQCPSGYTASGTGQGTCTGNVCPPGEPYIGPAFPGGPFPNVAQCQRPGGTGPPLITQCPSGYTLQTATGQCTGGPACPPGSTLQGQSCVVTTTTRPGQGNQR